MSRHTLPFHLSLGRRKPARTRRSFVPGQVGQSVLEARQVLSTATLSAGVLTVTGTSGADTIAVLQSGASVNAAGKTFATASVNSIVVNGLDGNDTITVASSLPATLNGGAGANTYTAPANDTVIDPILTVGRAMSKAVMDKYQSLGGTSDLLLGKPTAAEVAGYGGRVVHFQGGEIDYSAATGAHEVHGLIANQLNATSGMTDAFGHSVRGILGLATSDETNGTISGRVSHFQGGDIDWSTATGPHAVIGAINAQYAATAHQYDAFGTSVQKILGLPTGDEVNVPWAAGARMQTFQGGTIYSSAAGTHAVIGAIGSEYAATAKLTDAFGTSVQKILGMPTGDETGVPGVAGARMQTFQGGTIYSAASGTHAVIGAISSEYAKTAGEVDAYGNNVQRIVGLPTGDEVNVPGVSGARMQTFQGGTIYSSGVGTHVVIGAILSQYNAMGGAAGVLGLPMIDEEATPDGGRTVVFQHGDLFWSQATGVQESIALSGIPGGSPQYDNTTCGPNSASRFLRFYGFNVSYDQMRSQVKYDGDLVSRVGMGTRPSVMLDAIRKYRPQTQLEARVNVVNYGDGGLDHVLDILASGRPVIALMNPSAENRTVPGGHLPEELHWVVLTGYDRHDRTITFMNTDGKSYTETFDRFYQQWNWSASGPIGDILTGDFNVQPRTILY
jgi:uncharacterized protein with LGFP repeats